MPWWPALNLASAQSASVPAVGLPARGRALGQVAAFAMGAFESEDWMYMVKPPRAGAERAPRLALVVGSGGVRGVAAIGVAQVLAQAGIGIDLIAGCSSGALFGAVVASAWDADVALRASTTLWSQEVTEQRRWKAYLQLLLPRWTGFGEGFSLRSDHLIAERLYAAFGERQIEALPLPLRIVTTDAGSGQRHVLSSGPLVPALRASMALPFVFPSVPLQGRRLVDGVLSDPLPVSAVAEADLVLTLGFAGGMPRRVNRPARLLAQASTALMNNLQEARLEAARGQGMRVLPLSLELKGRVGLWQTSAMPALCEAGRAAAWRALPFIHEQLEAVASGRQFAHGACLPPGKSGAVAAFA